VHPYLTQALAAERVRDQQQQAALARLASKARRARRGRPDLAPCSQSAQDLAPPDMAAQEPVPVEHGRELAGVR